MFVDFFVQNFAYSVIHSCVSVCVCLSYQNGPLKIKSHYGIYSTFLCVLHLYTWNINMKTAYMYRWQAGRQTNVWSTDAIVFILMVDGVCLLLGTKASELCIEIHFNNFSKQRTNMHFKILVFIVFAVYASIHSFLSVFIFGYWIWRWNILVLAEWRRAKKKNIHFYCSMQLQSNEWEKC